MFVNLNNRRIFALTLKELSIYFNNPFGYVSIFIFISLVNVIFIKNLFVMSDGSMRQYFEILTWPLLVYIPVTGARLFSEEKKSGTIELLMSLPISIAEIVIAKFLTLFTFCIITLSLTIIIPITLNVIADPHIPTIVASYFGVVMLVIFISAITIYFSSISKSQITTTISSLLIVFCSYVIGTDFVSNIVPASIRDVLIFTSPLSLLSTFYKGVIDLYALVYFMSISLLFLTCTYFHLNKNRI